MKDVLKAVDKTSSNVVKSTPNKPTTIATSSNTIKMNSGQISRKQELPKFFENQTATDFNRGERNLSMEPKKDLNVSRTIEILNSNKQIN